MNLDQIKQTDPIYRRFMERQLQDALELEHSSDLLRLHIPPMAPPHVVAEFHCTGLIREGCRRDQRGQRIPCGHLVPAGLSPQGRSL